MQVAAEVTRETAQQLGRTLEWAAAAFAAVAVVALVALVIAVDALQGQAR